MIKNTDCNNMNYKQENKEKTRVLSMKKVQPVKDENKPY